jgi:hypothetical protein
MPELPASWDPRKVAVHGDKDDAFLLRPGQILADARDAPDVAKVLDGWKASQKRALGVTLFTGGGDLLEALARVRKATADRPQGPARVAPNHVLVGEAITFTGEPRIQGGPGSSARRAKRPAKLPSRGAKAGDGKGVKIAVLDTGLFKHEWLSSVQAHANSDDIWDVEPDGYADNESGHGTFIAGLIRQIAPAAEVYVVKVLDSHGVGDDLAVAQAIAALPADVDIVNLSLGGYTENDSAPLAIASVVKQRRSVVVAAAGNNNSPRPFWPAAFKPVLAVGALDEKARRAEFSNYGWWVDASARGVALQSTFARGKTKVFQGTSIAFDGWASWDGTSFACPITAAVLARTMTRSGVTAGAAKDQLLATLPAAPQPDFPLAVLVDELK